VTHYGVGYAIHIGLSKTYIQNTLGMGHINTYLNKGKNGVYYAITKTADVAALISVSITNV